MKVKVEFPHKVREIENTWIHLVDGDFRTGHNRMWAESLLTYSLVWRIIFIPHMITLSLKPQRTCASHRQMKATAPHRF